MNIWYEKDSKQKVRRKTRAKLEINTIPVCKYEIKVWRVIWINLINTMEKTLEVRDVRGIL